MTSSSGGLSSNDNELTLEVKKIFWESLLQSVIDVITKCDRGVLQSATAILLQSVIEVITKCARYYKVRRLLQSATVQTPKMNFWTANETKRTLLVWEKSDCTFCHEAKLAQVEPSFDLENHLSKMACGAHSSAYVMSSKL